MLRDGKRLEGLREGRGKRFVGKYWMCEGGDVFVGKCQGVAGKGFLRKAPQGKGFCAKHRGREERISWEALKGKR